MIIADSRYMFDPNDHVLCVCVRVMEYLFNTSRTLTGALRTLETRIFEHA